MDNYHIEFGEAAAQGFFIFVGRAVASSTSSKSKALSTTASEALADSKEQQFATEASSTHDRQRSSINGPLRCSLTSLSCCPFSCPQVFKPTHHVHRASSDRRQCRFIANLQYYSTLFYILLYYSVLLNVIMYY